MDAEDLPPFTLSGSSFEKLIDATWIIAALLMAVFIGCAGLIFGAIFASFQLAFSICIRTIKLGQREIAVVAE